MTPNEIAGRCAEEVFRTIEREQMINKGQITEAIERVILTQQMQSPAFMAGAHAWWPSAGATMVNLPLAASNCTVVGCPTCQTR